MTDENTHTPRSASPAEGGDPTVAFCQQCGRGLTVGTQRTVGAGIFCEPCATVRRGYAPVGTSPGGLGPLPPPVAGPNPALAGFLGLIPGVGAMYNGQYPKGVIHLVIFVVLTSLADNLNWEFWWFVWGWVFYQAFEAYHTAQARRDGLTLPDPFGWNDLGERLGFSRSGGPASGSRAAGSPAAAPFSTTPFSPAPTPTAPFSTATSQAGATAGATRPTAAYAGATAVQSLEMEGPLAASFPTDTPPIPAPEAFSPIAPQPGTTASSWTGVPPQPAYHPIYTGAPETSFASPAATSALVNGPQRFPAGAAWLIGLGLLFLIANFAPGWRLEARWLVPALLALLALWTGGRRIAAAENLHGRGFTAAHPAAVAEGLLGPALLLTVAVLLALQTARAVPLRHTWPALLIIWGALLFVGRSRPSPDATDPLYRSAESDSSPAAKSDPLTHSS